jgi:hypothetical protein
MFMPLNKPGLSILRIAAIRQKAARAFENKRTSTQEELALLNLIGKAWVVYYIIRDSRFEIRDKRAAKLTTRYALSRVPDVKLPIPEYVANPAYFAFNLESRISNLESKLGYSVSYAIITFFIPLNGGSIFLCWI